MKNNIEKVYGKLPKKVNLKNHKVNLESAQELKNSLEKADASWSLLDNDLLDWVDTYIDLQNKVNAVVNLYDNWVSDKDVLENSIIGFEEKANELGVNPMTFEGFQEASFTLEVFDQNIDDLQDTIDIMKSIPQL
jgi:copper chaperone CopZ